MLLRHEDFLADPEGMLREILMRVDSAAAPPDLSSLRTGFPLNGNRLIEADVVSLRPRVVAPRRVSRLTGVLQRPWKAVFSQLRPVVQARSAGTDVGGAAFREHATSAR